MNPPLFKKQKTLNRYLWKLQSLSKRRIWKLSIILIGAFIVSLSMYSSLATTAFVKQSQTNQSCLTSSKYCLNWAICVKRDGLLLEKFWFLQPFIFQYFLSTSEGQSMASLLTSRRMTFRNTVSCCSRFPEIWWRNPTFACRDFFRTLSKTRSRLQTSIRPTFV